MVEVAIYALQGIVKAGSIGSWPQVDAKLTDINLKVRHDSDGDLQEVVVKYEYFVDGNRYTSNKIHPTYSGSNMSGHRELYERLKNCSIVRARYNKENPREAYLVTADTRKLSLCYSVGCCFSLPVSCSY